MKSGNTTDDGLHGGQLAVFGTPPFPIGSLQLYSIVVLHIKGSLTTSPKKNSIKFWLLTFDQFSPNCSVTTI